MNHHFEGGLRQLSFTFAQLLGNKNTNYSYGLNVKYFEDYTPIVGYDFVHQGGYIARNSTWKSVLFDLGMRMKHVSDNDNEMGFGISVSNISGASIDLDKNLIPIKLMRSGLSYKLNKISGTDIGVLGVLEYQRSIDHIDKFPYWQHLSLGLEANFLPNSFLRIGYLFELDKINRYSDTKGFTYGIGFITPEISRKCPISFAFSYARGLRDYRELDENIVSMQVILK
jgi:hypothetical protein